MPLSAHKMYSYLNAIDESKEKYAYDHKIQKSEDKVAENDEGLSDQKNKTKNELCQLMSDESNKEKAEEKTDENTKFTTTNVPDGITDDQNATSEMKTILEKSAEE